MRFKENHITTLYNVALTFVAIISLASFVAVIVNERLDLDLSSHGFNRFLEIFRFPLTAMGTFLILLAGKIAVIAVEKTAHANLLTTKHALSKDFREYVNSQCKIPIYEFLGDAKFGKDDYLPSASSLNPTFTFNRIYIVKNGFLCVDDDVMKKISDAVTLYNQIRYYINHRSYEWVLPLYKLCVLAREFRRHLMLNTYVDEKWPFFPILEKSEEFGKLKLPNLNEDSLNGINRSIRHDLLCVIGALYFEPLTKIEMEKLFKISSSIGLMWANSDEHGKSVLTERKVNDVWANPYSNTISIELDEI